MQTITKVINEVSILINVISCAVKICIENIVCPIEIFVQKKPMIGIIIPEKIEKISLNENKTNGRIAMAKKKFEMPEFWPKTMA